MMYEQPIGYTSSARVSARIESISYYPYHLHENDMEIICVLNGEVRISESAMRHDLTYGDVYIFNCNECHRIEGKEGNIILSIHINRNHYSEYFPDTNPYFVCDAFTSHDYDNIDFKHLRFLMAKIYMLHTESVSACTALENYTKELMTLLLNNFQYYTYKKLSPQGYEVIRIQNYNQTYHDYKRIFKIIDYIYDHYNEKIKLTDIAKSEFITPEHLSRNIKATLGISFSELVALTRCEEAEKLLSSTRKNVNQIAEEVGFTDRKQMAAQFKKWFDIKPSEFRKKLENDLSSTTRAEYYTFSYDFASTILDMYLSYR